MPREVRIGSQVIGGVRIPVIAGAAGGGDLVRCDVGTLKTLTTATTARTVSPSGAGVQPPLIATLDPRFERLPSGMDAVLVDAACVLGADARHALAAAGLPLILRRAAGMRLDVWLEAADSMGEAGAGDLLLCEGGAPTSDGVPGAPDLALVTELRRRYDPPVLVDVSGSSGLTAAAVAAGADGLLLPADADAGDAGRVTELVAALAPLVGDLPVPGTLEGARQAIDQVDVGLATLLERRAELAGAVQRLKPVGGFAGRDRRRESEVVTAMAVRAPGLGLGRIRRIMETVIEAGLELSEAQQDPQETPERAQRGAGSAGGPSRAVSGSSSR